MKSIFTNLFFLVVAASATVALIACEPAAKSASQAFDNANSVLKEGGDKLFMDSDATPAPITATYAPGN